jgi:Na+/H+ antiporter NhaD/arsenite permease-like protein
LPGLVGHPVGLVALALFAAAYGGVVLEERLQLRKSVPVIVAAGLIWVLIGIAYAQRGQSAVAADAIRHNLLDYAELFLFLIVAMTYVNTMSERGVFDALRAWLLGRGFSLRRLFWATGALAFVISPFADNLTTALVMGAVAIAIGTEHPKFVTLACINIVVAANAGGAFSPFGDITTLMVWQRGIISFTGFLPLFVPALINWLVPATLMSVAVEPGRPGPLREAPEVQAGAWIVVALFVITIAGTVLTHSTLHLPPAAGMMLGLGLLKLYSYGFNFAEHRRGPAVDAPAVAPVDELDDVFAAPSLEAGGDASGDASGDAAGDTSADLVYEGMLPPTSRLNPSPHKPLNVFEMLERVEWDTLMFFYGVILGVGGLGTLGYLTLTSQFLYEGLGPTWANVLVGGLSALIDNVPIMFAVLSMEPAMPQGQWLLVTLTAGVGGSLLSVGSAAGVALMGQSRGSYTFLAHLRWAWAIALGYVASIAVHLLLNRHLF